MPSMALVARLGNPVSALFFLEEDCLPPCCGIEVVSALLLGLVQVPKVCISLGFLFARFPFHLVRKGER